MNTIDDYLSNIKPLTDRANTTLDEYITTHNPVRTLGYLDGLAELMQHIMVQVVANADGGFRPLSAEQKDEKLRAINDLCQQIISSAPSRLVALQPGDPLANSDTSLTP